MWDIIALTCRNSEEEEVFIQELNTLKELRVLSENTVCMVIADHDDNIGSGGSSINALYIIIEQLSIKYNYSVINSDVYDNAKILIMNMGRNSSCNTSNNCFSFNSHFKPQNTKQLPLNLYSILKELDKVVDRLSHGIWITSTDMFLEFDSFSSEPVSADALILTVSCNKTFGFNHGIVFSDEHNVVTDIHYSNINSLNIKEENVDVICGVIYLAPKVVTSILSLTSTTPVLGCTYQGQDKDMDSFMLSLYFDLLVTMTGNVNPERYYTGLYGLTYDRKYKPTLRCIDLYQIRKHIYSQLNRFKLKHLKCEGSYIHMGHINRLSSVLNSLDVNNRHCYPPNDTPGVSKCNVYFGEVDIKLENKIIIQNCSLRGQGQLSVSSGCYLNGLDTSKFSDVSYCVPAKTAILEYTIESEGRLNTILVYFGVDDLLHEPWQSEKASVFGITWGEFMKMTKLSERDLWPEDNEPETLMNARLYTPFKPGASLGDCLQLLKYANMPCTSRLSFSQVLQTCRQTAGLQVMKNIYWTVLESSLSPKYFKNWFKDSVHFCFIAAVQENRWNSLLRKLDIGAAECDDRTLVVQYFACIADLLSCMAGSYYAVRNGPGANRQWREAFGQLEKETIEAGVMAMAKVRDNWLNRPLDKLRAARHYESGYQIYIRQIISQVRKNITLKVGNLPPIATWVIATAPLRVDLQGGWSDTPPVCYEVGGSVINVGIQLNGKKPLIVKGRRTKELALKFTINSSCGSQMSEDIMDLEYLMDYNEPLANFALLKAAMFSTEILFRGSSMSLQEQLMKSLGSGLEIVSESLVPQGSGLGTSSILAAAVITVIWILAGKRFSKSDVIHCTLFLEQLLTTGGGWQDQVGGVYGHVCHCYSSALTPGQVFKIHSNIIPLSDQFLGKLERHLILIYTGKVRLAKYILQNVVRNWYGRKPAVLKCFDDLISKSKLMLQSLISEDLKSVGKCLSEYWELKKGVAPGCSSRSIDNMMSEIDPYLYGQSLAGAGGGGFLIGITKHPNAQTEVFTHLKSTQLIETHDLEMYDVSIDRNGITVMMEGVRIDIQ